MDEERDYEAEAKEQGHRPLEEWDGDPEQWKDAKKFVEDGENILAIVRKNRDDLKQTVETLTAEQRETKKAVEDFRKYHEDTEKRVREQEYEKAYIEIMGTQREAVEEADTEKYDAAAKELADLNKRQLDTPKAKPPPSPEFPKFKNENTWYGTDQELTVYADSIIPFVSKRVTNDADFYKELAIETKKRFPEKFENKNRNKAPDVGSGSPPSGGGKGKKTYANLPTGARATCDRFVKEIPGFTKEQFCKDFEWEE